MSNKQNDLFRNDDFEETKIMPEKVTCLGIQFPSNEARRQYFREELRKRLPELKSIEGFPIGEDDDIINLSDPPYYTICPNPWLNDFVDEWEKEKELLLAENKRNAKFEVKEPYASDVSEGKNNPIYMAHAYHTKVPHPAIMRYILHYTQPGDIVFDGFCGTGMTGVAAQLCGSKEDVKSLGENKVKIGVRHGLCSDLSPIASLIAGSYNISFNPTVFEQKAHAILKKVESELGWMYETLVNGKIAKVNYYIWSEVFFCPNCGSEINLWDSTVSEDTKSIKDTFECPHCGTSCQKKNLNKVNNAEFDSLLQKTVTLNKYVPVRVNYTLNGKRGEKCVDEFDLNLIGKINAYNQSSLKTQKMVIGDESSRILNYGISHYHQFYTRRNFIYLSRVHDLVSANPILMAWFTSSLQNSSKMYKFRTDRKGGILAGTLFIPSLNMEIAPYSILHRKISDFKAIYYKERGNSVTSVNSSTDLRTIREKSVDYIFIDPPFGANIMYSELNSIWEGWMNVFACSKEEAIVNNSQEKTIFDYQSLMHNSLKEFYRILKPNKWLTMEFSNTSAAVWNSIQNALQGVGFVIVNVAALDKKQGSFKAVTTTTAVKQDLIITCYKPSDELMLKFETSIDKASNSMEFIEELLVHLPVHLERENSTTSIIERSPKILYDRLISYYVQHGYAIPMDAQEFQKELRNRFIERDGMFFTASQALEYEEKKNNTDGIAPMALFVSSEAEGIEWLKRELDTPQTYADLQPEWMKAMVTTKKGDVLPELMDILKDNFIEDEDGKWRKPDAEKAADLEIIRNRKLMKEFNLYLEQAQKPKAKRMKDTRLEVLRYGFKECYKAKDYHSIVVVGDHIQESLLQEDEVLLQYYDIASSRV